MKTDEILELLNIHLGDAACTLNYTKDYELLIATILSQQCTDDRVNKVTPLLFEKYNIFDLAKCQKEDIIDIIRPCGNMHKKSEYIIEIAKTLVNDFNGSVPNDRVYLENLKGVGRKTANVLLSNIYNEPCIAVDTHVERVSKRLGIANDSDSVLEVEQKLMNSFDKECWAKLHHQLLLFGRYTCTSRNPKCDNCYLKKYCKNNKCI